MPIISLRRGDDLALKAKFSDKVTNADADLTGWSVSATLQFSNCPPVELTASFVSPSTGEASVELADTETAKLQVGEHNLRVRLTNPAGVDVSAPSAIIAVAD